MTTNDIYEESNRLHAKHRGKIGLQIKVPIETAEDLSLAYTPGVAEPCRKISQNKENAYAYTSKGNLVAIATNGSAVLGLGDIGPEASLPVMEGKSILFKKFANIDAFPVCVNSKDSKEFIDIIEKIASTFGGINLEDIAAPQCFEIEEELQKRLNIPVFHDDQHGTAIVVLAALINSLSVVKKDISHIKVVINGAGAAGIATAKLLQNFGISNLIMCDSKGIIYRGRSNMNPYKQSIVENNNHAIKKGALCDALYGADVFIGLSLPNLVSKKMVQTMAERAIIFALANPVPEIMPKDALEAGAAIVCTGRSDFPNQVNNVLAFPGIFRGALDIRASCINSEMKYAAAQALASLVSDNERSAGIVIPNIFDPRVEQAVSQAVAQSARESGVAKDHFINSYHGSSFPV